MSYLVWVKEKRGNEWQYQGKLKGDDHVAAARYARALTGRKLVRLEGLEPDASALMGHRARIVHFAR